MRMRLSFGTSWPFSDVSDAVYSNTPGWLPRNLTHVDLRVLNGQIPWLPVKLTHLTLRSDVMCRGRLPPSLTHLCLHFDSDRYFIFTRTVHMNLPGLTHLNLTDLPGLTPLNLTDLLLNLHSLTHLKLTGIGVKVRLLINSDMFPSVLTRLYLDDWPQ